MQVLVIFVLLIWIASFYLRIKSIGEIYTLRKERSFFLFFQLWFTFKKIDEESEAEKSFNRSTRVILLAALLSGMTMLVSVLIGN